MNKFEKFCITIEHKILEPYIHWSHLGLEAQYWAGGWDDSRKQGSRLDAHSIFCMKFFEGSYYGFAYLIVISRYIPSKKRFKVPGRELQGWFLFCLKFKFYKWLNCLWGKNNRFVIHNAHKIVWLLVCIPKLAVKILCLNGHTHNVRFISFGQGVECRNWCWMSNISYCYLF